LDDRTQMANVSVKCGTDWKPSLSGPISGVSSSPYSSIANAFSIRSSLPHTPTTRRKQSTAPRGTISRGLAGESVPGQRSTGTGCWRGA
jgi:hypothetical protein